MSAGPWARWRATTQGEGHHWWVLGAVECGNFVVYMDAFIVALALPAMARDFGVGIPVVKWVMLSYMVAGRLTDGWGRKAVTCVGMGGLMVTALLCMVVPGLPGLIACRVVQGVSGALVLANVMAGITEVFPKAERRRAMAVNASVLAAGQVAGLLLGGALIEWWGWRSIFGLIAAVAALGLVLDGAVLRNQRAETVPPLDGWGAALWVLVVGVPFLLIESVSFSLSGARWWLLLAAIGVLLVTFLVVERRRRAPLLDVRLLGLRAYVCGSVAAGAYFVTAGQPIS